METGKKAVESVKETTANIGASAKSGMDKTKATVQEKVDKMKANGEYDKALATEKKQERVTEAELHKQQAMSHNAAEKDAKAAVAGNTAGGRTGTRTGTGTGLFGSSGGTNTTTTTNTGSHTHSTTGGAGLPSGTHHMSAVPGHGTGEPGGGFVEEGAAAVGAHTIGKGARTAATNRGTNTGTGYNV